MNIIKDIFSIRAGEIAAKNDCGKVVAWDDDHDAHHLRDENWDCVAGRAELFDGLTANSKAIYESGNTAKWLSYQKIRAEWAEEYLKAKAAAVAKITENIFGLKVIDVPLSFDTSDMDGDEFRAKIHEVISDAIATHRMSEAQEVSETADALRDSAERDQKGGK